MTFRVPELPVTTEAVDGDHVVLASGPAFGLVDVRLVFADGAGGDADRAGLAAIAWDLCERGAGRRDRIAFHEALELHGADLRLRTHRQSSELTLRVLEEHLPATLDLVADALIDAHDSPDDLDDLREETAEGVAVSIESPDGAASRCVPAAVWTEAPWNVPMDGTDATRDGIDVEHCTERRRAILGTTGWFGIAAEDPTRLRPLLDAFRQRLRDAVPRTRDAGPLAPERRWNQGRALDFDAPQAVLTVLSPGPDPECGDWPALALHATAFGDGFASPLVAALRGRDGLSYDVDWSLYAEIGRSVHVFRCSPAGDQVARALAVADEVWRDHAAAILDDTALERAKATYVGARLVAMETVERRLAAACTLGRLGLPLDRLWTLPRQVSELTAEEVAAAASRYAWGTGARTIVAALPGGHRAPQWKTHPSVPRLDAADLDEVC